MESACKLGSGNVYIEVISPSKKFFKFSEKAVCPETGFSFSNPEPRNFSFNVASSWCKRCCGIGYQESIDIESPRSSRTVPFVAKASGLQIAKIAMDISLGKDLKSC